MLTMTCLYADYKCGRVRVFWFFSSIHNLLSTFLLLLIFGFNCRLFIIPRKKPHEKNKKNVQELYCLYINVRRERKKTVFVFEITCIMFWTWQTLFMVKIRPLFDVLIEMIQRENALRVCIARNGKSRMGLI